MGGSYGGIMAHSLVRMFKERVEKVVITAAGPPNPENSKQLRRMMPLFRFMPLGIIKRMLTKSFQKLVAESDNPDMHMLWGITREVIQERIKRADLVALTNRLIDQTDHYTFNAQDLVDWQGEMLFILGGKDPSTGPEKIKLLQDLYPKAQIQIIADGSHAMALNHQEQYFAYIDRLLKK
jgi:pimeloyl-ACP methyl ester carboxylesterase